MRRPWSNHIWRALARSADGAVAPTIALSLVALIAVGGVAFDYARLVSMDSELQNAADQAALAAASQLDGKAGACARAALAASSLIDNNTRFGKYSGTSGTDVTVQNEADCDALGRIKFYEDIGKVTAATDDATAKFVEVEVDPRKAFYAFTPIVAAFSSVDIKAIAFAGVGSAVCGAVPFFICSPDEPVGNTDVYRLASVAPGTGIAMLEGGTQWGPGNFGFLDQFGKGANGVKEALSSDVLHQNCQPTENVTTETGQMNSFRASFNMRFDFTAPSGSCPVGPCSPSTNVRKDLVRPAGACSWQENPANGTNWQTRRYRPTDLTPLTSAKTPEFMGHPRDMCHAVSQSGVCSLGRVGDGVWDRAAYFRANHPGLDWAGTAELGASVTRYATYLWEAAQEAISPNTTLASQATTDDGSLSTYSTPQAGQCLYPGIAPDPDGTDRRRVTAAIVNCRAVDASIGLNGKKTIPVTEFVDVFLVEPSVDRVRCDGNNADADLNGDGDMTDPGEDKACKNKFTDSSDVYIEIIGTAGDDGSGGSGQITRRDVPYLIE